METHIFKRILVPCDFSDASRDALKMARKVAAEAELRLLHVLPPIDRVTGNVVALAAHNLADKERSLEKLKEMSSGELKVSWEVRFGDTAGEIVWSSADWNANLIVMPARSHGAIQHALLGSVTERVLRLTNCPVLVIPPQSVPWK